MSKNIFFLKNINIALLNEKYGFKVPNEDLKPRGKTSKSLNKSENETPAIVPTKTTKISDIILIPDNTSTLSFLDEKKQPMNCLSSMSDLQDFSNLPSNTDKCCYWCRHKFNTHPIGCPIKYVNYSLEKTYTSNITKDEYYLKENITKDKLQKIKLWDSDLIKITVPEPTQNCYLTEGIFCSFNCVLAYIQDNKKNVIYKESESLLRSMYIDLIGGSSELFKLSPAPDWKLLKEYGGPLSIDEFRGKFQNNDYEFLFYITYHPDKMKMISKVYKERNFN